MILPPRIIYDKNHMKQSYQCKLKCGCCASTKNWLPRHLGAKYMPLLKGVQRHPTSNEKNRLKGSNHSLSNICTIANRGVFFTTMLEGHVELHGP